MHTNCANWKKSVFAGYFIRRPVLMASLVYLLVSTFLTWPLIFQLNSVLFGDYGDTRGGVWWQWAKTNGLLDAPINHLVAAPFGLPMIHGFSQPVTEWIVILLTKVSNEIAAYNLFVFLSFPLTALATYLFLDRLLHNKIAAFVGGLVFGFCPAAVMQAAGGHAVFSLNAFIPLFLLALFYNRGQHTLLSAFYVAASFALITFTALYLGYFAIYIAIFFVVFDILNRKSKDKRAIYRSYLYCTAIAVIMILPFEYQAIYQQLTWSGDALAKAGHIRDLSELAVYSSRLWEFIIPSIDHPVFGGFFIDIARIDLHGSNIFEHTLYLGFIPLFLCLIGLFLWSKKHYITQQRRYFLFFVTGALLMLFLSMPPFIIWGPVKLPTVSYFMYKVAPMFRVYARFGILVNFFLACAATLVLTELSQRMQQRRYYLVLAILLPLLIFEYWSIPPHYARSIDPPPAVYQWLAKEPGDFIIAEYPMMKSDEAAFYTYLFWQRIHKKRMVNGASSDNPKAWDFYQRVNDLSNPETPQLLKSVGVKYILVHKQMYWEGEIPESLKRYYPPEVSSRQYNNGKTPANALLPKPFKDFGDDVIYALDRYL